RGQEWCDPEQIDSLRRKHPLADFEVGGIEAPARTIRLQVSEVNQRPPDHFGVGALSVPTKVLKAVPEERAWRHAFQLRLEQKGRLALEDNRIWAFCILTERILMLRDDLVRRILSSKRPANQLLESSAHPFAVCPHVTCARITSNRLARHLERLEYRSRN